MIEHHEMFLRAGEAYENMDDTLTVCDQDESVLVFLHRPSYERLIFNKPVCSPSRT